MQHKNKQKPTKDPFIKYYIVWPIQSRVETITNYFKRKWRKLTGAWWCDYCEAYHGRRVHKFICKLSFQEKVANSLVGKSLENKNMCSLWKDAQNNNDLAN